MIIIKDKQRYYVDDEDYSKVDGIYNLPEENLIPYELWQVSKDGHTIESLQNQITQLESDLMSLEGVDPELIPFIEQRNQPYINEIVELQEKIEVLNTWQPQQ